MLSEAAHGVPPLYDMAQQRVSEGAAHLLSPSSYYRRCSQPPLSPSLVVRVNDRHGPSASHELNLHVGDVSVEVMPVSSSVVTHLSSLVVPFGVVMTSRTLSGRQSASSTSRCHRRRTTATVRYDSVWLSTFFGPVVADAAPLDVVASSLSLTFHHPQVTPFPFLSSGTSLSPPRSHLEE